MTGPVTTKQKPSIEALNKPESKEHLIARLLVQRDSLSLDVSAPEALEFRRDQYGLTRTEFAFVLGIERTHYNEIINGKRGLTKQVMRRAFAIGVPAPVILQSAKNEQ